MSTDDLGQIRTQLFTENGMLHLAEKQAQELKAMNPTLKLLASELRRAGFLSK